MSEFLRARPEELGLDPERERLIDELVDIEGERIGKSIIWRLLFDPEINRVFFMGAPGSGKSTLLGQAVSSIERLAVALKVPLVESITLYENELYAVEESKRDTPEFNGYFLGKILNPRTKVVYPGEHPKFVNFVESPSVGKTFIRDRGVTAFERLASMETNTLFVNIVPHPILQIKGVAIRTEIPPIPDKEVIGVLANKFKVIVSGVEHLPPRLVGSKIKSILRRNALAHHMRTINLELEQQVREWFLMDPSANKEKSLVKVPPEYSAKMTYKLRRQFYEETYGEEVIPSMATIAESLQIQSVRDWVRVEAAFAKHRFESLGLDKDKWSVVFNRFYPGPIIWRIT